MPVRAIQTRAKWHKRDAHGRNKAPQSPLTRFLTSSGTLSSCSVRIAKCTFDVWIVPVGVTGARGRCAALRSVQDAGDSPCPRCCSRSELSSASPPNGERHPRWMMPGFHALWLLVCWNSRKRVHAFTCFFRIYWIDGFFGSAQGISFLCLIHRLSCELRHSLREEAPGASSWGSPTFTRITFSCAGKEEPCLQKCRGSTALKPVRSQSRGCFSQSG